MTKADAARELIRKFPEKGSRTLGRILYEQNQEWFTDLNHAQTCIRYARARQGTKNRAQARNVAPDVVKMLYTKTCPPSAAEPWLPVQLDGPLRILSLSDVHIPFHSQKAVEASVAFGKKYKPDVVVLLGDILDFYNISRWEKNPKHRDLKGELDAGKEFLSWLRGQFRKARIIFKLGNHEDRWNKWIWAKAPELWNIADVQLHNMLDFEKFGVERVDDQPILAGHLPMLHGHETGRTISSPVNPARGLFLRTKHTALIGHLHQTSGHGESNMWHDETFCWSQGCLSDLCPAWLRVNRWNHGFATIDVAEDNQFDLSNYRLSADYNVRTA